MSISEQDNASTLKQPYSLRAQARVEYKEQSLSPQPKTRTKSKRNATNRMVLTFSNQVNNTLGDSARNGYKPNIDSSTLLLAGMKKLIKNSDSWSIDGAFLTFRNNKIKIINSVENINTQPMPLIIEILAIVKELTPDYDISNELFDKMTKNMDLPLNYLKFKKGDHVLLRPSPKYARNGDTQYFDPIPATIAKVLPHSRIGDISAEYEITVAPNNLGIQGGSVHEANIRQRDWISSAYDTFETEITDILTYEAERALKHRLYKYLSDCGILATKVPYLDVNSAFFNNKMDYYLSFSFINETILSKLCNIKIISIIDNILLDLKPNHNNNSKEINITDKNKLRQYGKTFECAEMHVAMNLLLDHSSSMANNTNNASNSSSDEKINDMAVQVSYSHVWLVFESLEKLRVICNISESNLKHTSQQGTKFEILCNNDSPMQFIWCRKDKLLSLNHFKYQTSVNSNEN